MLMAPRTHPCDWHASLVAQHGPDLKFLFPNNRHAHRETGCVGARHIGKRGCHVRSMNRRWHTPKYLSPVDQFNRGSGTIGAKSPTGNLYCGGLEAGRGARRVDIAAPQAQAPIRVLPDLEDLDDAHRETSACPLTLSP